MTPQLRFPGFADEWQVKMLGDLVKNIGGTALEKYAGIEGTHKFISIGNYSVDGKYIDNGQRVILNEKTKPKLVNKSDIVMVLNDKTAAGDIIGSSILIDQDNAYIYNQRSERLIPKEATSPLFLWQILNTSSTRKKVFGISQGGTQIYVNFPAVKQLKINLPPKPEQEKIAEFLTAVDERVALQDKKVELLQKYKKSVMQKIFSQKIRFKDENGSDYPDWQEKKLGDSFDVRDGTHESPQYHEAGKPLLTSKNLMASGKLDLDNVSYISILDFNKINQRSKVDTGDILFGMIGTIGNPVRVTSSDFAIKNVALIKQKIVPTKFLIQYLRTSMIEKQFHEKNAGGTQKFIALGDIRGLSILQPAVKEQEKITNFLTLLDDKINIQKVKLTEAKKFKKALLQRMFV